jgi:O-antigen ligase
MAIPGALERPVFGWGQENFSYVFNKYYQPSMFDQEQWFDRTHDEFLDWFVAGGIPAFYSIYPSSCSLSGRLCAPAELPEQAALLGSLAAYGFSNLTVFHDLMSFIYFFLIMAFAHGLSQNPLPRWIFLSKQQTTKWLRSSRR